MDLIPNKTMFCMIHRSTKHGQAYLYVEKRDGLSHILDELMRGFGAPQTAVLLLLDEHKKLVSTDLEKVIQALSKQDYYLQLPPPFENLLKKYLAGQGKQSD